MSKKTITGFANYMKFTENELRFYKRLGYPNWYCPFCGHEYTDGEVKKLAKQAAKDRAEAIRQIRAAVESSKFAGKP